MPRYINGFNVSMYFHIKGKELEKLRASLKAEGFIRKGKSGYYWYDLDKLMSMFKVRGEIPQHLIRKQK